MKEFVDVEASGDVAVLVDSESESDAEDTTELANTTELVDTSDPVATTELADTSDPVATTELAATTDPADTTDAADTTDLTEATGSTQAIYPNHATHATDTTDATDTTSTDTMATVPPQHIVDEENDEFIRAHVLNTCAQMMHQLEAVRLSVLHLQYSIHAGDVGVASVEHTTRAGNLWTWDKPSVLGTIFVPDKPSVLDTIFVPEDTSQELEISDAEFSDIHVFGGGAAIGDIELAEAGLDRISNITETSAGHSSESCV